MTKEQIINQYISVYEGHAMEKEELEIMLNGFADDIVNNLKPSLPDNLDEAAMEYAYNNWEDNDYHTGASEGLPFDAIGHTEKCFKAGAEWMEKQGVSVNAISSTEEDGITEEGMKLISDYLESLPDKTEVVLQIRKKQ